MENNMNPTPEELAAMLEKARKDMQEMLDKMTPEEREQAEIRARKLMEEDEAEHKRLLESAAEVLGKDYAPAAPKTCPSCGAPAEGGKFCTYCGNPLESN